MPAKPASRRAARPKVSPKAPTCSPVERAGLDKQVGYALRRAQLAVFNDLITCLKPFAMRPAQYAVLSVIEANPGINQQQLGDSLAIQRPNLSALLDGLERDNMVRRERMRQDARSFALKLTSQGAQRLKELHAAHLVHQRRLAKILRPAAKVRLLESLGKLAALGDAEAD
jgi:DNA-binding MarR family transcriptional regulator